MALHASCNSFCFNISVPYAAMNHGRRYALLTDSFHDTVHFFRCGALEFVRALDTPTYLRLFGKVLGRTKSHSQFFVVLFVPYHVFDFSELKCLFLLRRQVGAVNWQILIHITGSRQFERNYRIGTVCSRKLGLAIFFCFEYDFRFYFIFFFV